MVRKIRNSLHGQIRAEDLFEKERLWFELNKEIADFPMLIFEQKEQFFAESLWVRLLQLYHNHALWYLFVFPVLALLGWNFGARFLIQEIPNRKKKVGSLLISHFSNADGGDIQIFFCDVV